MKKIVLLVMIAIASWETADAQRRNKQNVSTEQRVEQQVKTLDKKLNLSDEQELKVKQLYEDFFNAKISREQRKNQKLELNKKIESLLTAEQKKIYSTMKTDTQQRKRHQR